MIPTLRKGEVRVKNYTDTNYVNGDIIVFNKNNIQYIKRIYASPGDKVTVCDKQLYINNKTICTSDAKIDISFDLNINEYYVMGDNFENSIDSRDFGIVYFNEIEAKIYE